MDWVEHIACRTEQSKWTIQSALLDGPADCSYIRSATYATRKTYRRHQSEQGFLSLVSSQGKQTLPYPTSHTTSKDWQNIAKHFGDCEAQEQLSIAQCEAQWSNVKQYEAMWSNVKQCNVKNSEAMWSNVEWSRAGMSVQGWEQRGSSCSDGSVQESAACLPASPLYPHFKF